METISDPEITIHLNTVETEAVDITRKQSNLFIINPYHF